MSDLQQRLVEKIKELEAELSSLREKKETYEGGIGLGLSLNGKPLKAASDDDLAMAVVRLYANIECATAIPINASKETMALVKDTIATTEHLRNSAYFLLESRQCAAKITSINALLAKARSLMSQDSKVADFLKDLE
jgi:hypothetical protein